MRRDPTALLGCDLERGVSGVQVGHFVFLAVNEHGQPDEGIAHDVVGLHKVGADPLLELVHFRLGLLETQVKLGANLLDYPDLVRALETVWEVVFEPVAGSAPEGAERHRRNGQRGVFLAVVNEALEGFFESAGVEIIHRMER